MINIEVAYGRKDKQVLIPLSVEEGTTIEQAIEKSGVLQRFPEIDLTVNKVGIFNKVCKLQQTLQDGDRVEIYRPLLTDPKESRRQRASKDKAIHVDSAD